MSINTTNAEAIESPFPATMVTSSVIDNRVSLSPFDLASVREGPTTDLKSLIFNRVSKSIEGKCHEHGYVIPGSVKLLNYGVPKATLGTFTGDMVSRVSVRASVFRPAEDSEIDTLVLQHNKAGIYVRIAGVLQLRLPRDYHITPPEDRHSKRMTAGATIHDFESVRVGDKIRVRILRTRFQLNDTAITGVGELMSIVEKGTGVGPDPYAPTTIGAPGAAALLAESIVAETGEENVEEAVPI